MVHLGSGFTQHVFEVHWVEKTVDDELERREEELLVSMSLDNYLNLTCEEFHRED